MTVRPFDTWAVARDSAGKAQLHAHRRVDATSIQDAAITRVQVLKIPLADGARLTVAAREVGDPLETDPLQVIVTVRMEPAFRTSRPERLDT